MGRRKNWTLEQQLLDGRTIDPVTECWLWRHADKRGYGKLTLNYKTLDVHRASAHVYLGFELGCGLLVLHKCKNKHCFNPEHLYIGTQSDNIRDSVRDRTHHKAKNTHCPKGHEYTEENTHWYEHDGWRARYCKTCAKTNNRRNYLRRKALNGSSRESNGSWRHSGDPRS